jgi:hypothetical protein
MGREDCRSRQFGVVAGRLEGLGRWWMSVVTASLLHNTRPHRNQTSCQQCARHACVCPSGALQPGGMSLAHEARIRSSSQFGASSIARRFRASFDCHREKEEGIIMPIVGPGLAHIRQKQSHVHVAIARQPSERRMLCHLLRRQRMKDLVLLFGVKPVKPNDLGRRWVPETRLKRRLQPITRDDRGCQTNSP